MHAWLEQARSSDVLVFEHQHYGESALFVVVVNLIVLLRYRSVGAVFSFTPRLIERCFCACARCACARCAEDFLDSNGLAHSW